MSQAAEVLVDSDAFVAYLVEQDVHHDKVTDIFYKLRSTYRPVITTNLVVAETASLLSRRFSYELAARFIDYIRDREFPLIFVDAEAQDAGYEMFLKQKREGTSFVDCLNVVVVQRYALSAILSFDKFYRKFEIEQIG